MKKIVALALALCMLLGMTSFAAAETTTLTMWTFIAQHQDFYETRLPSGTPCIPTTRSTSR